MPSSIIAENSTGAASKAKEVTLPVYADDLADNVRAGFDNTCVYIKDCTYALEERLNSKLEAITSRLDALMDNIINPLAKKSPIMLLHYGMCHHNEMDMLMFLLAVPFHRYMEVLLLILRMMLVMHHDSLTLMLVVQLLFMLFLSIEVVLVMLLVYHWMMVLGVLKFRYNHYLVQAVLRIIWSGRCA
jgi:hypothetical protein